MSDPLLYLLLAAFAVVLTALGIRYLFPILKRRKMGQSILEIGPTWHKNKEGTPTMGGAVFPAVLIFVAILSLPPLLYSSNNESMFSLLFLILYAIGNAAVGIYDDTTKLKNKRNKGIKPWQKLVLQALLAGLFVFLLHTVLGFDQALYIPFFNVAVDIGILYDFLVIFLCVGIVNCANLTDGLDGLCAASSAVMGGTLLLVALLLANSAVSLGGALILGVSIGFLFYNRHPARIFMGDTGSLFLGAMIAGCGILLRNPLFLIVLTLVFEWEGVSDILQVIVYKLTGKRVFRMAPFHHHLESIGYSENKIVLLFVALSLVASTLSLFFFGTPV